EVDSVEVKVRIVDNDANQRIHLLLIDPERCGSPAHAHGAALSVLIWIDSECNASAHSKFSTDPTYPFDLQRRLCVNLSNLTGNHQFQVGIRLPRSRENDVCRCATRRHRQLKFACRRNLQTATLFEKESENSRIRIGLHRVTDGKPGG